MQWIFFFPFVIVIIWIAFIEDLSCFYTVNLAKHFFCKSLEINPREEKALKIHKALSDIISLWHCCKKTHKKHNLNIYKCKFKIRLFMESLLWSNMTWSRGCFHSKRIWIPLYLQIPKPALLFKTLSWTLHQSDYWADVEDHKKQEQELRVLGTTQSEAFLFVFFIWCLTLLYGHVKTKSIREKKKTRSHLFNVQNYMP